MVKRGRTECKRMLSGKWQEFVTRSPAETYEYEQRFELAMTLVCAIRETCPRKYIQFVSVCIQFQAGRLDKLAAIEQMGALLIGHPSLIRQFNTMLPEHLQIAVPDDEPAPDGADAGAGAAAS